MTKSFKELIGTWHIVSMEQWDEDYLNMETQAYIEFKPKGVGKFQFGLVQGYMDYRVEKVGDRLSVEFTWEGSDECDPASGRGQGIINGSKMTGNIYIHLGDDSGFTAVKQ